MVIQRKGSMGHDDTRRRKSLRTLGAWEDVGHGEGGGTVERAGERASQLVCGTADILGAPFCPAVYSPLTADLSYHRVEALSSICLSYGRRGAERGPDCQHPFPGSHEQ